MEDYEVMLIYCEINKWANEKDEVIFFYSKRICYKSI